MKTLEQAIEWAKNGSVFDGRDLTRLAQFMSVEQIKASRMTFNSPEAEEYHTAKEWTRENILEQLKVDVDFGFEKALNQRGLSADLMHGVVTMWNQILEDGLEDFDDYAQYGLPLFKATAVKYGFDNPIGDDTGSEDKYASN